MNLWHGARQFWQRQQRRFSPGAWRSSRPNALQTRSAVQPVAARSRHPHWIVGRGLCLYRHENFAHVPPKRRADALRLQLPVWSPFAATGHHCVWAGAEAMVWLWDAEAVRPEAVANASFEAQHAVAARVCPETVFHPRQGDGAYAVQCAEGWELQCWRDAALVDSFWSPEAPDAERRAWFLQRHGFAADLAVATPPAELAAEPWASPVSARDWLAAREWPLAVAVTAIVLAAALWQEARLWKVRAAASAIEAEFAARQDELGPVLAARAELNQLRRRATAMRGILAEPSQARVMGVLDAALPSATARFRRWRYQQGELSVLVEDAELDPVAYVQALEPHFASVEVGASRPAQRGGEETIEITLRLPAS